MTSAGAGVTEPHWSDIVPRQAGINTSPGHCLWSAQLTCPLTPSSHYNIFSHTLQQMAKYIQQHTSHSSPGATDSLSCMSELSVLSRSSSYNQSVHYHPWLSPPHPPHSTSRCFALNSSKCHHLVCFLTQNTDSSIIWRVELDRPWSSK